MRLVSVKAPPSIPGTEREGKFNYFSYLKAQNTDAVCVPTYVILCPIPVTLTFIYLFITIGTNCLSSKNDKNAQID